MKKAFVLCSATALLAVAVACSKSSPSPVSPGANGALVGEAAADGSTLKVTAPATQSPVNGAQPQTLTLVAGASTAQYAAASLPALTYEFQILSSAGTVISGCTTTVSPSGSTVTANPACTIAFDTNHRWRVRARSGSAHFGPWSAEATFRSPIGGYINGNEIYDPLYNGITVGQPRDVEFRPNQGAYFRSHESKITYQLNPTLPVGEMSVMVTGIDEGNPGDKTKIFSMQEGNGTDITDNDYRMTAEKRGEDYETPGATTWRINVGDKDDHDRIIDGDRIGVGYSDERWYFWKFTWGNNQAQLTVREDGPNGRVIYNTAKDLNGFQYRPVPHFVHLGTNIGRAGPIDASIPRAIYKNFWVSSRPRPVFPNE